MSIEITSLTEIPSEAVQVQQELLAQLIQEQHPELDIRRGAFHDLILYLHGILAAKTSLELDRYKSAQSLLKITQDPSLADEGVADQVLSNYNLSRKSGTRASGTVRVEYTRDLNTLIPAGTAFTAGDTVYRTAESRIVYSSSSSASPRLEKLPNGNWGFTVQVLAESAGATEPVPAGTVLDVSLEDAARASAVLDFTPGRDSETNLSMVSRLADGIATPCWGSRSQITALIHNHFPDITGVSVIGFGDEEMQRDRSSVFPLSLGGKADIYIKTAPVWKEVSVTATFTGINCGNARWVACIPETALPGCWRAVYASLEGNRYDVTSQTVLSGSEFGSDQQLIIHFETDNLIGNPASPEFTITLVGVQDLDACQKLFQNRELMPVTADARVLASFPAWVDVTLTLSGESGRETEIRAAVTEVMNQTGFPGRIPSSEILRVVLPLLSAEQSVLSIQLDSEVWGPESTVYRSSTSQTLEPPHDPQNRVTARTTAFFARDINIQYKN